MSDAETETQALAEAGPQPAPRAPQRVILVVDDALDALRML